METNKLNKVLLIIIAVLLAIILAGTVYGLVKNSKTVEPEVLIQQGKAINLAEPADTEDIAYFDVGKIRIITLAENGNEIGSPAVLHPWLEYPKQDTVFYEELARKQNIIKAIFSSYFCSRTRTTLISQTETIIEKDLLNQINERLSLGQISDIYFTDYIFLD